MEPDALAEGYQEVVVLILQVLQPDLVQVLRHEIPQDFHALTSATPLTSAVVPPTSTAFHRTPLRVAVSREQRVA
jgi:hypothetical protein